MKFHHLVSISIVLVYILLSISGCSRTPFEQTNRNEHQRNPSKSLNEVINDYHFQRLQRNPVYATFVGVHEFNDQFTAPITLDARREQRAFEEKFFNKISKIDPNNLKGQDLLSFEVFKRDRELNLQGLDFNLHLIPITQMSGAHNTFARLGSGASAQPFDSAQDYRDFFQRSEGFRKYIDSVVDVMREGIQLNFVLPRPVVEKLIPQVAAHIVDDVTKSVFYGPINRLQNNETISEEQKITLKNQHIALIKNSIIPTYTKLHKFLINEYLPASRDTVGLYQLPQGKAIYKYRINLNTTLDLDPEEIHQFGLSEVARILSEMRNVKRTVGFDGNLNAFFDYLRKDEKFYFSTKEELIKGYTQIKEKIDARLPALFDVFPKAPYEVRAVESFREASSAGASYQRPAPDGS